MRKSIGYSLHELFADEKLEEMSGEVERERERENGRNQISHAFWVKINNNRIPCVDYLWSTRCTNIFCFIYRFFE